MDIVRLSKGKFAIVDDGIVYDSDMNIMAVDCSGDVITEDRVETLDADEIQPLIGCACNALMACAGKGDRFKHISRISNRAFDIAREHGIR